MTKLAKKLACAVLTCASAVWAITPIPELISAVKAGDRTVAAALLQKHANVNATEVDGTSALHWAVRANDLKTAELLLAAGANVNAVNRYGVTPLSLAASNGDSPLLTALLKAGADVQKAEANLADGQKLLMLASRSGNVESVQALLAHGVDVNATEPRTGTTALIWAAAENRPFVVRALLKAGAQIDVTSAIAHFPHTPPAVGGNDRLEEGVSYVGQTPLPKGGWTPLMYAAREGAMEAARTLAETGAKLDVADPEGTTALVFAIINGHYELAEMLVDKGANVNLPDRTGMGPLYAAVDMHTMPSTFGRPDLTRPVIDGSVGMTKYLLAHGADPNAKLSGRILKRVYNPGDAHLGPGATPFMRAARGADASMMRILLEGGADPTLTQKNMETPIMLATGLKPKGGDNNPSHGTEAGSMEAIKVCLERGLDINARNEVDETAVFLASGSPQMIRFLVEHGARLDIKNHRGQTPLEAALQAKEVNQSTVAVLRELTGNGPRVVTEVKNGNKAEN